jgi:dienelactone hydrolase
LGSAATADAADDSLAHLVAARSREQPVVSRRAPVAETALSRTYDLGLTGPGGRAWRYFIREPHQGPPRAPAIVVLAGIETGRQSLGFIAERNDMIVLAVDYPYRGPERLEGLALLRSLPAMRQMGFDTVEGVALAVTYLSQREDVDPTRIVLLGVSFGSIFAIAEGGNDPRPCAVVAIYGGGDLPDLARRNLAGRPWWVPSFLVAPVVRAYFGAFEPLSHVAGISPRYFLMVASDKDEMFPPQSARALFARAGAPKKLISYETGHMDLFDPSLLTRLTSDVVAELETAGLLHVLDGKEREGGPGGRVDEGSGHVGDAPPEETRP